MFDYNKFFKENSLDVHNQPERHDKIASLCVGYVLDIGCGTGSLTAYFRGRYNGVDVSDVAIKQAKEYRRKNASFCVRDMTTAKDVDFSIYNTIIMSEFLEHIENDDHLFDMIKKTACPGTKIIISVPNFDRVPSPDHVRTFTVSELKEKFSKIGTVTFHNWIGACERILMTIDFGVPQENILTLGIVAKDEGQGIEKAILSAIEYVDNIVVLVDDRTKDKTEEIARRYTSNVFLYKWDNDFSGARNLLISKCETPWVLFIDGHEYLEQATDLHILKETKNDAIMCQIKLESDSVVRYPRLHRTTLKYEDKVHNRLVSKSLGHTDNIHLVHDRTNGQSKESTAEREKQRDEMVIGIMGEQLKKDKKNVRASLHLGLHYHARLNYNKAIECYKLYLKYSTYAGERWYVRFNLSMCYLLVKKIFRAEYQTVLMKKENPGRWETDYCRGLILMDQGKYREAILYLVNSLDVVKQECAYKPIVKDYSKIWNYIGECYFKLSDYYKAGESFSRAHYHSKDDEFSKLLNRRSKLMLEMAAHKG